MLVGGTIIMCSVVALWALGWFVTLEEAAKIDFRNESENNE